MNQQMHTTDSLQTNAEAAFTLLPDYAPQQTPLPEQMFEQTAEQETGEQANTEESVTASASALNALLQSEICQKRRDDYTMLVWGVAFTLSMLWMTHSVTSDVSSASLPFLTDRLRNCMLLLMGFGGVMMAQIARISYRRKRQLTQELSKQHDLTLLGPLIDTLRVENTAVRNLCKQSLITLLPTLQASDAELLTDARRNRLLKLLAISPNDRGYRDLTELFSRSATRREIELRVSVLKAFEQVGGAKELPVVERLAQGLPTLHSTAKRPPEVIQAAKECLPFLQSRAGEQRASEQLLRASSAHDTPGDILLRPAQEAETAPQELLRAASVHPSS